VGHAEADDLACSTEHRGGLGDLGSFVEGELIDVFFDAPDEGLDVTDLILGGQRLGAGPVVDVNGGEDAFAVAEQVVEVCLEVWQVGHVGAEVVAAHAPKPEGAGAAAGGDVGGFVADAVRHGDLSGTSAGVGRNAPNIRTVPHCTAHPSLL
jgi:hypothetical protein